MCIRDRDECLHSIRPEDLVKFGFIPEFIGRVPVITALDKLDEESLIRILTEPKNALVKQYQKLVKINDKVSLEFTESSLRAIAQEAIKRDTGARGLRSIVENAILELIYQIPSLDGLKKCLVTEDVITKGKMPLLTYDDEVKSASN